MTNTNLPEKLEVTVKYGQRDWKVELQKISEKIYNEKKYVTYRGNISRQDVIKAAEVLKSTYWNWDVFVNAGERTIVFRKQI